MNEISVAEKTIFFRSLEVMPDQQFEVLYERIVDNRHQSDWKRVVVEKEMIWRDNLSTGVRPHFKL
jgi:hypothetical protein